MSLATAKTRKEIQILRYGTGKPKIRPLFIELPQMARFVNECEKNQYIHLVI